jgi:hypothetical protein
MGRFELVRDDEEKVVAIAADGRWIVHLVSGTDRNEANAAKIVAVLNAAAAVLANCHPACVGVSNCATVFVHEAVALEAALDSILPRRTT